MKYKIKHFAYFGELNSKIGNTLIDSKAWDLLRVSEVSKEFNIPQDRNEYEKVCNISNLKLIARKILEIVKKQGCTEIVSVGVGRAALEFNIKKTDPDMYVKCLDYTPEAINILNKVFPECDKIEEFDMLSGNWNITKDGMVLFYRVSTELTVEQWKDVFKSLFESKADNILFIPTENLSIKILVKEKLLQLRNLLYGHSQVFCGYMYSKDLFKEMWQDYYIVNQELNCAGMYIYVLKRMI